MMPTTRPTTTAMMSTATMDFDSLIEPADALRVAEAITSKAIFITTDEKLVDNKSLQKKFDIKIKFP